MTPNQKTGIYLLLIALVLYATPPLIVGVPVPIWYLAPALIGMIPLIVGGCCLMKVFD